MLSVALTLKPGFQCHQVTQPLSVLALLVLPGGKKWQRKNEEACREPEEGSINITSAGVNEMLGRVPKMGRRSFTVEAP